MKKRYIAIITVAAAFFIFGWQQVQSRDDYMEKTMKNDQIQTESAVFAGGCFWCTESDFEKVDGVVEVISGYTGGHVANPDYKQVSSGGTGHVEAVKVIYDPTRISYKELLAVFWRHVNPTDAGGQFVDRGDQYRSAIFYADERQRKIAESSKRNLAERHIFDKAIVTDILPLNEFYRAEDYHQDYYKENPIRYRWYRSGSGRDQFLEKAWAGVQKGILTDFKVETTGEMNAAENANSGLGKTRTVETNDAVNSSGGPVEAEKTSGMKKNYDVPDKKKLQTMLTALQYEVTQKEGTEPPFKNAYWDNHAEGIYVDIVSGEPLFSSKDKYESGTGWPSFTQPLVPENIVTKEDRGFFTVRTEVRSKHADSHLGHVFEDGPPPSGLRYCMNSAALRFVPRADLEKEGYGEYRALFDNGKK